MAGSSAWVATAGDVGEEMGMGGDAGDSIGGVVDVGEVVGGGPEESWVSLPLVLCRPLLLLRLSMTPPCPENIREIFVQAAAHKKIKMRKKKTWSASSTRDGASGRSTCQFNSSALLLDVSEKSVRLHFRLTTVGDILK